MVYVTVPRAYSDLDILGRFISNGTLKAKVEHWYTLKDIKQAFNTSLAGHVAGKVGIRIDG